MANIKDVAREAGTSISTVSKALNGSYTISEETKAHVAHVAERLGYRPNTRAQSFARKSTRAVVFLAELEKHSAFEKPHMFEILTGAQEELSKRKYVVLLQGCTAKDVCPLVKEIISGKRADGLIIHTSVVTKDLAQLLIQAEIPYIIIGKPNFQSTLCWIDNDNRLSGNLAAKRLKLLGHTRIALACGYEDDHISESRLEGMRAELCDAGEYDMAVVDIFRGASTIEDGKRIGLALLDASDPFTAVICTNNFLAVGCLRAFREKGIRVPDDISIITFDEYPFAKFTDPPLTAIGIDLHDLGAQAGRLLIHTIKKPGLHIQSYSTRPVLVERQSDRFVGGFSFSS